MIYIEKQENGPIEFVKWVQDHEGQLVPEEPRKQWGAFKGDARGVLQETLLSEQGAVCAYCNKRIHRKGNDDVGRLSMEHLKPISPDSGISDKATHYHNVVFNYHNIVGACTPQRGRDDYKEPHCGVRKDNYELPEELYPTRLDFQDYLKFTPAGEIYSHNSRIQEAIDTILNLNCSYLLRLRESWAKTIDEIMKEDNDEDLEELYLIFVGRNTDGNLHPFCGFVLGYLQQEYQLRLDS